MARKSLKTFIEPAKNISEFYDMLVKNFAVSCGKNKLNNEAFAKDVLAYSLALKGLPGIFFYSFPYKKDSTVHGSYNHSIKTVLVRQDLLEKQDAGVYLVNVIFHEVQHIWQEKFVASAKRFTPNFDKACAFYSRNFEGLVGLEGVEGSNYLYLLNSSEQDAFSSCFAFGQKFGQAVLDYAKINLNKVQQKNVEKMVEGSLKAIEASSSRNLVKRYEFLNNKYFDYINKSNSAFDKYFSLAKTLNSSPMFFSKYEEKNIQELASIYHNQDRYPISQAIRAVTDILEHCPKRENVESLVSFVAYNLSGNTFKMYAENILDSQIPLTQGDFAKILLSTENFKGSNSSHIDFTHLLNSVVDEKVWANTLLTLYGKDFVQKELNQALLSGYSNFNFNEVQQIINNYSGSPIAVVDGKNIYGANELVDKTLKYLQGSGQVNSSNYQETKQILLQNMHNIVSHFNYPNSNNAEYIKSLQEFINNPFEKQFEDTKESFSEKPSALEPECAAWVENCLGFGRLNEQIKIDEHKQQEKKQEDDCVVVEIENLGSKHLSALNSAIKQLNSAIEDLTNYLKTIDRDTFLKSLGIDDKIEKQESVSKADNNIDEQNISEQTELVQAESAIQPEQIKAENPVQLQNDVNSQ